jgi:ribonuclease D
LIDTEAALLNALPRLAAGGPWALDTEFMRVDTYYPRLCLLQIATPALAVCIDPLAVRDLSPLDEALRDPTFPKLMHAAKQDLEALSVHGNHRVSPVRDTQIAASLLGLPFVFGSLRSAGAGARACDCSHDTPQARARLAASESAAESPPVVPPALGGLVPFFFR